MARFGILTGGGDAPGLNAVIRGVVRRAGGRGHEVVGIRHGWRGILERDTVPLDLDAISGILHRGGTILRTSRTNPYKNPDDARKLKENLVSLGLDCLIACGGEDTLGVAAKLHADGVGVVGVPKTIDNDLSGTDVTFGFDTALSIATEAIDRLHTTAESHDRILVVEVMGRHAGWIALESGVAGGADFILTPEAPTRIDDVVSAIRRRQARGKNFAIIVVAEGAALAESAGGSESSPVLKDASLDAFGHVTLGGAGERLAAELKKRTGLDTRSVVLGHVQRGGTPSARDRWLGSLFGIAAADLAERRQVGMMVALRAERIIAVPISEGVAQLRTVDPELLETARTLFG